MTSLRNFFITFIIALLVFGVCAYFITGFVVDSANSLMSGPKEATETTADITTTESESSVIPPLNDEIEGESFNILLIGTDYRPSLLTDYHPNIATQYPEFEASEMLIGVDDRLPEYPFRTVHADAVMLVCVNKEKQTVAYMNIPTNMQLNIGGVTTSVADLYYEKGLEYFVEKISGITGVEIGYYALTSVEQIVNVIDEMGAINFTVPCDMEYIDDVSGLSISLTAGMNKLSGEDVAGLLAFDSYTQAGLSREKTIISFLKALAQKMTNPTNIGKAIDIFTNIKKYLYSNVGLKDLERNVELIFSYNSFRIVEVEYPGSYYYSNGVRYFNPNISSAVTKMSAYK